MSSLYSLAVLVAIVFVAEGNPLSRIIGGSNVNIEDHPWQASLQSSGSHICGASFIGNKWLVTAAHCVYNQVISSLSIGYGDADKRNHKSAAIENIIVHPEYTEDAASGYPHDIALISLFNPVEFNAQTKMISLPSEDFGAPLSSCSITGWGCTNNFVGICLSTPNILQGTAMNVMTPAQCNSAWSSVNILDGHICVYMSSASGCNGDSGGPLSCLQNGIMVLAGATSWGSSTCATGSSSPTVYTRVSEYVPWINSVTGFA